MVYGLTIILIFLNGINYRLYFNNLKDIASNLTKNVIYISEDAKNIEHYFILHRESALINLTENNKCFYFQYVNNLEYSKTNQVYERDLKSNRICFSKPVEIVIPNSDIKHILDNQYYLIFDWSNLNQRLGLINNLY